MLKQIVGTIARNVSHCSFSLLLTLSFVLFLPNRISIVNAAAGDALYFTFQPTSTLPTLPSSLLIQSPSFISVPAGATLSVHLMRGDLLVSTSKLSFPQAYENTTLVPPVPIASFVPLGSPTNVGQPLPGASLVAGEADLTKVAMALGEHRLLWSLSSGLMGTPGRAIVTGAPVSFVDLKFVGASSASSIGDQKPGSVLFFNRYTSNASNSIREDTIFTLTNTSPTAGAFVRIFFVNAATCETVKMDLCLAAQQTISYQMSDLDPGVRGYIIAVATNQMGEPAQFNWLTGNTIVRQPSATIGGSFTYVLNAIAIAKRKEGEVKAGAGSSAELIFDNVNYDRLPLQSAFDGVQSQVNAANSTTLALYRPLPDLGTGTANAAIQLTAWGRGDANQVTNTAGSVTTACYADFPVSQLRLQPLSVAQLLPSGATAWFAVSTSDQQPLMGAMFNSGQFNSGGNARALSHATEYRIKVPVSTVTCPQ